MIGLPCISSCEVRENVITIPFSNVMVKMTASTDDSLETGGSVWHAAMALANYMLYNREKFRNKVVVELGSGCGLCGLLAGLLGAKHVIFTDIPEGENNITENIKLNKHQSGCKFSFVPLLFGEDLDCMRRRLFDRGVITADQEFIVDIVLASDVGYDVSHHEPLLETLRSFLISSDSSRTPHGILAEEGKHITASATQHAAMVMEDRVTL
jgi:predicted nicotinamide N-methyase